mmetsp:Transcript_14299/g.30546  ORF Transcript_14299/g.30546 Transcript_14299/m.30546 type:complete len:106 (+) Transcript_14299:1066-1383(+)
MHAGGRCGQLLQGVGGVGWGRALLDYWEGCGGCREEGLYFGECYDSRGGGKVLAGWTFMPQHENAYYLLLLAYVVFRGMRKSHQSFRMTKHLTVLCVTVSDIEGF